MQMNSLTEVGTQDVKQDGPATHPGELVGSRDVGVAHRRNAPGRQVADKEEEEAEAAWAEAAWAEHAWAEVARLVALVASAAYWLHALHAFAALVVQLGTLQKHKHCNWDLQQL